MKKIRYEYSQFTTWDNTIDASVEVIGRHPNWKPSPKKQYGAELYALIALLSIVLGIGGVL